MGALLFNFGKGFVKIGFVIKFSGETLKVIPVFNFV